MDWSAPEAPIIEGDGAGRRVPGHGEPASSAGGDGRLGSAVS